MIVLHIKNQDTKKCVITRNKFENYKNYLEN